MELTRAELTLRVPTTRISVRPTRGHWPMAWQLPPARYARSLTAVATGMSAITHSIKPHHHTPLDDLKGATWGPVVAS